MPTLAIAKGGFNVRKLSGVLLVYIPSTITVAVIAFIGIFNSPYRMRRLLRAINPSIDHMGAGYIVNVTRNMIFSSKLIGQGGLGADSSSMLPNVSTDHMLTYLIHRYGWIVFILIMIVILAFIIRSFILCSRQKKCFRETSIYFCINYFYIACCPLCYTQLRFSDTLH